VCVCARVRSGGVHSYAALGAVWRWSAQISGHTLATPQAADVDGCEAAEKRESRACAEWGALRSDGLMDIVVAGGDGLIWAFDPVTRRRSPRLSLTCDVENWPSEESIPVLPGRQRVHDAAAHLTRCVVVGVRVTDCDRRSR
jgi:hypothetical protein